MNEHVLALNHIIEIQRNAITDLLGEHVHAQAALNHEEQPDGAPDGASDEEPEEQPEEQPDGAPDGASDDEPDGAPDGAPEEESDEKPDGASDGASDEAPEEQPDEDHCEDEDLPQFPPGYASNDRNDEKPAKKQKIDNSDRYLRFVAEVILPLCRGDANMHISLPNLRKTYNGWAVPQDYELFNLVDFNAYLVTKIPNFKLKRYGGNDGFVFNAYDTQNMVAGRPLVATSVVQPFSFIGQDEAALHRSVAMFVKREWIDSKVSIRGIKYQIIHAGYVQWCGRHQPSTIAAKQYFSRVMHNLFPSAYMITVGPCNSRLVSFDHERGAAEYARLNY
jgi:hypothetical protein